VPALTISIQQAAKAMQDRLFHRQPITSRKHGWPARGQHGSSEQQSGIRRGQLLLEAHRQAADAGAQLRLVIPPSGPVGRLAELTGIDRLLPVYPALQLAIGDNALSPGQ